MCLLDSFLLLSDINIDANGGSLVEIQGPCVEIGATFFLGSNRVFGTVNGDGTASATSTSTILRGWQDSYVWSSGGLSCEFQVNGE